MDEPKLVAPETVHVRYYKGFFKESWLQIKTWLAIWLFKNTPLVSTSKGNIPEDRLEWAVRWEVTEEAITYVETYRFDGEIVKEARAVLGKRPLPPMRGEQANLL